eukprot:CAMPEP_0113320740 /NCGR_PEP_ID=MMETSP0010_2-20120614/14457_1 /TAXON_ID=216773 ORGANISM="Corethron hystrix, Strain 308" /NCGR_SAMPLE_ID=MMETSP0010_2 /ASSEMBLY_ACC=CAM_ASM_000155 /LENGTH=557 /DNA_ID=CAMNT_0000178641 /DNA_START=594 /DNA_END=2263 /DNA_ORIENTATION=+ /assembly_acc=CAM_ASM_000155
MSLLPNKLNNNAAPNLSNIASQSDGFTSDQSLSGPVAPKSLVEGIFTTLAPGLFRRGMQEDSHEFLRLLIDGMQRSENIAVQYSLLSGTNSESKNGDEDGADPSIRKTRSQKRRELEQIEIDKKEEERREKTRSKLLDQCYPYQLFRGTVESTVTCPECNKVSKTTDPIEDIGLEIEQSVLAALKRFVQSEVLDEYLCTSSQCGNKKVRATKQSKFSSIPPVLTLHLKRFRYGNSFSPNFSSFNHGSGTSGVSSRRGAQSYSDSSRNGHSTSVNGIPGLSLTCSGGRGGSSGSAKIEGHIKFQNLFDMHPYLTETMQHEFKNMLCRLFAVVVHSGKSAHSGHYFAYVQSLVKNEWWKMDDGAVRLVSQHEVMTAEAYMLFYRVVNPNHSVALKRKSIEREKECTHSEKSQISGAMKQGHTSPKFLIGTKRKRHKSSVDGLRNSCKDSNMVATVERKRRKRRVPLLKNGAEWKKKNSLNLVDITSSIARAEEWISYNVELKSSFFEDLQDEAKDVEDREVKGENTNIDCPCLVDKEDIQEGGIEGLRNGLLDIFSKLL